LKSFCINNKKKIFIYLTGGLGNQLFQYAAARNLAIKNDSQLILDKCSGFIFDYKFKRNYQLKVELNNKNIILKCSFFLFTFLRILKKILRIKELTRNFYFFEILHEFYHSNKFYKKIIDYRFKKKLYLMGLFQSEKYFIHNKKIILEEIWPPKPDNYNYLSLYKNLNKNSVAIGIRMYETLSPEEIKKMIGSLNTFSFYERALKIIISKIKRPNFFLFSTKNEIADNFLIRFPNLKNFEVNIITEDGGFSDPYSNLWLMSHFKNFIISNSTFYWWGAYFSSIRNKKQTVITSNNFPNKDFVKKNWTIIGN
jgi:hypothetical protein